jgi:hypothetical protein
MRLAIYGTFDYLNNNQNGSYGKISRPEDVIEGYNLIDSLKDNNEKQIVSNQALLFAFEDSLHGEPDEDNYADNNKDASESVPIYYSAHRWPKDSVEEDEEPYAFEDNSSTIKIAAINKHSFSLIQNESDCEEHSNGPGYCNFYTFFMNYEITADSLYMVSLDDLFDNTKDYSPQLNALIIQAIKNLKEEDIDCSNPDKYLEGMEKSFAITNKGLIFYLAKPAQSSFVTEPTSYIELTIPYSSINNLINRKGVLAEFVK